MEDLSINKKLSRFKNCNKRFYPYIEKVLNRFPEEVCLRGILDDLTFEVISFGHVDGQFFKFPNLVKNLVVLNESILKLPEVSIIHCIAHEFAHKVAESDTTDLCEKEAEELLLTWGFEEESKAVNYDRPILESEGYKIGYEWARRQKEEDLDEFERFYHEWNEDRLTRERFDLLHYAADTSSIIEEMLTFEEVKEEEKEGTETIPEKDVYIDEGVLDKGIIWGIMGYLKEKKERWKSRISQGIEGSNKAMVIETLEKSYHDCMSLLDRNETRRIVQDYMERLPEMKSFFDSLLGVAGFLDNLKD